MSRPTRPDVILGPETFDDAGVIAIGDDTVLVQTVDFFPPIVDDPYDFGRIAAANALSDIYAMGASPLSALNLVAFPADRLDGRVLVSILSGAAAQLHASGTALLGGHSIRDAELKFGLAVTGIARRRAITTNAAAMAGDQLILTKPLGTGAVATALKRRRCDPIVAASAISTMAALNATAAMVAAECGVKAATDITGFGLMGHSREMAAASDVTVVLHADRLPFLPGALDLARASLVSGASDRNRGAYQAVVRVDARVPTERVRLAFDAETSGGLLLAVPAAAADRCLNRFVALDVAAWPIGEVIPYDRAARVVLMNGSSRGDEMRLS